MIVALDIKEAKETQIPIPISFVTKMTTRLDPDELIQEKKLGEGSFGIVYLGTFGGNKVAIKRMKQLQEGDEEKAMKEFNREKKSK